MDDSTNAKGDARTRARLMAALAGLVILAVAMSVAPISPWAGKPLATVDFTDVVLDDDMSTTGGAEPRTTLRVAAGAMVSPRTTRRQWDALLSLVAARVDRRAVLVQRKTYAEINDMIARKEVDVALVCTAPYVLGNAEFGMELLAVPVTQGRKVYHSYILVHRDSDATSFDDLRGRVFALTDPESNTGCLVPKYMLLQRAETAQSFFADFFFTYSHDNAIKAVAGRMADGAAVDSLVWEYLAETDPVNTSQTKIIERSPPYGIPPIVVHPDLDRDLKDRLETVFLTLHGDVEARELLRSLRIDRFEEGDPEAYESVRTMLRQVETAGGEKP